MSHRRIVVYGNAGAGKTTLARWLHQQHGVPMLSLDSIALLGWDRRRSLEGSLNDLRSFMAAHESWIVEGSYGNLIEATLPHCTDLRFMNPGVDICLANCEQRYRSNQWEWCGTDDDQSRLDRLLLLVRTYEWRTDEFSLARHRRIFDGFLRRKAEYRALPDLMMGMRVAALPHRV